MLRTGVILQDIQQKLKQEFLVHQKDVLNNQQSIFLLVSIQIFSICVLLLQNL